MRSREAKHGHTPSTTRETLNREMICCSSSARVARKEQEKEKDERQRVRGKMTCQQSLRPLLLSADPIAWCTVEHQSHRQQQRQQINWKTSSSGVRQACDDRRSLVTHVPRFSIQSKPANPLIPDLSMREERRRSKIDQRREAKATPALAVRCEGERAMVSEGEEWVRERAALSAASFRQSKSEGER